MSDQIQVQKEREDQEKEAYNEIIDVIAQQILEENEEEYARKRWLKRLRKLGLVFAQMYHCNRCNYLWLPKDFDASFNENEYVIRYLERRQPPKACARCKSRFWNTPPTRKTKHTNENIKDKNIFQGIIGNNEKIKLFGHDMLTAQRLRLVKRRIKKSEIEVDKATQHLEEMSRIFGLDREKNREEDQRNTPEQSEAEWSELKKRMFESQKSLDQKEEERERAEQLEEIKNKILLQSKKDPHVREILKEAKEEWENERENKK